MALSERLAARNLPGVEICSDFQLATGHAHAASGHELVVFADAQKDRGEAFSFREIEPGSPQIPGSDGLRPDAVLALCQILYGARPRTYVLGISGIEFGDVGPSLSEQAVQNLCKEQVFFLNWMNLLAPHAVSSQEHAMVNAPRHCVLS